MTEEMQKLSSEIYEIIDTEVAWIERAGLTKAWTKEYKTGYLDGLKRALELHSEVTNK